MQNDRTDNPPEKHVSEIGTHGIWIMLIGCVLGSYTNKFYFSITGIIVGTALLGWQAKKNGKLKQFLWMHGVYLLIFGVLMYFQRNGTPWY